MNWQAKPFWIVVGVLIAVFALIWYRQTHASAPLPPLPVTLSFRKESSGPGEVAQLKNLAATNLPVAVKVTRDGVAPWFRNLEIKPSAIVEIGQREGWSFAPGDNVELSGEGFAPSRSQVSP